MKKTLITPSGINKATTYLYFDQGRALLIVRAMEQGTAEIRVSGQGLSKASVTLTVDSA